MSLNTREVIIMSIIARAMAENKSIAQVLYECMQDNTGLVILSYDELSYE